MKILRDWIKRRREKKDEEMRVINENLMNAGYLCPDLELHAWELLEWEENIRNMICKKCGKQTVAMAKTI